MRDFAYFASTDTSFLRVDLAVSYNVPYVL